MMKHMLMTPVVLGATLLTGQTTTPARQGSTDDIVREVRALRADIHEMAETSLRAQLLLARLQVEEQRIAGLARELNETQGQIRALESVRNPFVTQMLTNLNEHPPDTDEPNLFAGMKAQLEKIENGDPALKERQARLSQLLSEEQARWTTYNAELEALERRVTATQPR
jgi:outer membrane murein-binding lipoprotein Lpp